MEKYFEFLNNLRESGEINMFGAPAVLREVFDLSKQESYDVFTAWAEQFSKQGLTSVYIGVIV